MHIHTSTETVTVLMYTIWISSQGTQANSAWQSLLG